MTQCRALVLTASAVCALRRVPPTPHNSCVLLPDLQESLSDNMAGASKAVLMQARSSGTPPPLVPHNSAASSS